jgi:small subunit ribosomal protein S8
MMITDPIGDFIIRLKNAAAVRKASVSIPFSNMKHAIALTLKKAGYIGEVSEEGAGISKMLVVGLMYDEAGNSRINGVKRVSKPGRRLYSPVSKVFPIKYGKGVMVLTTPKGILTDAEARKNRVGGETLFTIW